MMNRKGTRILFSTVLAAALVIALGAEAHAARGSLLKQRATTSSSVLKPGSNPSAGDPDYPNTGPMVIPKLAAISVGGQTGWALRIQIMVQAWLAQHTIRRLP